MAICNCFTKPNNNFAEKFKESPKSGVGIKISLTFEFIKRETNKNS